MGNGGTSIREGMMDYRTLAAAEVELLRQLDRSEVVDEVYSLRDGRLSIRAELHELEPEDIHLEIPLPAAFRPA